MTRGVVGANSTVSLLGLAQLNCFCSEMRRVSAAQFDPGRIFDFVDVIGEQLIVSSCGTMITALCF